MLIFHGIVRDRLCLYFFILIKHIKCIWKKHTKNHPKNINYDVSWKLSVLCPGDCSRPSGGCSVWCRPHGGARQVAPLSWKSKSAFKLTVEWVDQNPLRWDLGGGGVQHEKELLWSTIGRLESQPPSFLFYFNKSCETRLGLPSFLIFFPLKLW